MGLVKEEQKQNSKKSKKTDDKLNSKGLDTFYRTLSRNHYLLLRMVDTKAAIIITVNFILITVLLGVTNHVGEAEKEILRNFFSLLIYFSIISVSFALIGMLPHKYIGKKFKQSQHKGSLYAGNFAERTLSEFKSEIATITKNGKSIYDEMTTDLYFLGLAVKRKQTLIKLAVIVLVTGLLLSAIFAALL